MKRYALLLALVLPGAAAYAASAEPFDWPQWQGPDRTAISKETGLLKEWPKGGPPLAWKIEGLGGGYSEPSIAAGRIYGMSNQSDDEVVFALSESDGTKVWTTPLGSVYSGASPGNEGPGCTPTVDGDRLYVVGMGGDVACLQTADGKIVWRRSFTKDFGGRPPMWCYRESPLLDGDKLICTPGGPDAMLVALDKLTGKTIWKSKMPATSGGSSSGGGPGSGGGGAGRGPGGAPGGPGGGGGRGRGRGGRGGGGGGAGYASAIAIDFEGQREYVQFTAKAVIGVAASDGKFLWRYDGSANGMSINCATPIYHDGEVFTSSAYGAGGGLVKLTKDGDSIKADEVYHTDKLQNHHGGMILLNGCLYGANGGNGGGNLVCLDFQTGKVLWKEGDNPKQGVPKGSVALVDGRLYYRTEDKGTVLLIEPDSKKYIECGRFEQPNRSHSKAWSHPVIANGKLYIRDQDLLFCYDVKAK